MKNKKISVRETVIFGMLGTILFCSKMVMEALPNIHLCAVLIAVYTLALGAKALIPTYIFILLIGLFGGFSPWWIPYLYIWLPIILVFLVLPKRMPKKVKTVVYPAVLFLHGLAYGTLYAPAQALMFGFDFEKTVAWIVSGLPFDFIHGIGNLVLGFLVIPLSELLTRLIKNPSV